MRGAVEAAVEVAFRLGVGIAEPVVLRDLPNVLVHLAPSPIVARVARHIRAGARTGMGGEGARARGAALRRGASRSRVRGGSFRAGRTSGTDLVTLWEYVENEMRPHAEQRLGWVVDGFGL